MNSMEKCVLGFLNIKIWFNFKNFKYGFDYDPVFCKREDIEMDDFFYIKRKWGKEIYYAYKDFDGKLKTKRCHTVIAEKMMRRKLYYGEITHHIDGNYLNNDPNNLIVLTRKDHISSHSSLQKCIPRLMKDGDVGFCKETKRYYIIEK